MIGLDTVLAIFYNDMAQADRNMVDELSKLGSMPAPSSPEYEAWITLEKMIVARRQERMAVITEEAIQSILENERQPQPNLEMLLAIFYVDMRKADHEMVRRKNALGPMPLSASPDYRAWVNNEEGIVTSRRKRMTTIMHETIQRIRAKE